MKSLESITHLLKDHGLRPSVQRVRIYEYLVSMKNHPTIEMIYDTLQPEMPSLSKTTIYNTLKTFVKAGIVQPITIEEHEMRYDADISTHIHFKCTICSSITDFFLPEDSMDIDDYIPGTYTVEEKHLYAYGICGKCRNSSG